MTEHRDLRQNEFYLNGGSVGVFLDSEMPLTPGRHRYEPYRSDSHFKMGTMLQTGYPPRCYYYKAGLRVSFTVRARPKYGILELSDF
ncbi:MAG TPA: hypothetical protein VG122_10390, partial [Gemmata sp.]|nr:hypothetical protein [Gemmata sp.]